MTFKDKEYLAKDFYYLIIENSFILENLKFWNIVPQKSMKEQVPDILKNNINFFYSWLRGIVDGDGSVFTTNQYEVTQLHIDILVSKELGDWINNIIQLPCSYKQHKQYETLVELKFFGSHAFELTKRLWGYPNLSRKWYFLTNQIRHETILA